MKTAQEIATDLLRGARAAGCENVVVKTDDVGTVCAALLGEQYERRDIPETVGDGYGQHGPSVGTADNGG